MSAFRIDFEHRDLVRMYKTLDAVGKAPQKALNKGTSKAAMIVRKAARSRAPEKTGTLKRSIVTRTEHSYRRGKKVRDITFDRKANALLQKPIQNPGVLGGSNPKAYYPASQEYGFLARVSGGVMYVDKRRVKGSNQYAEKTRDIEQYPSRKVEGKYFMRDAAESASEPAKAAMIDTMTKELDKIWQSTT